MIFMPRTFACSAPITLVLTVLAVNAQGPGEQVYKQLQTEWDSRLAKLSELVKKADSKEAKDAANQRLLAERQKYADALIQFAQSHPKDSLSIDVLLRAGNLDKGLQNYAT
jgi:hypothetical protein